MKKDDIVIVAAKRTPMGALLGKLAPFTAPELGAIAHEAALNAAGLSPTEVSEVISGCVLQAGIGQAPARQAALKAGIPAAIGATTINKMCGSGMKAVILGHDMIKAGSATIVLAGGMESMSNAPYLLNKARAGYRLGHGELHDHLFLDGLEDAYDRGKLMGYFAEITASHYQFSREEQDAFAIRSMSLALKAQQRGYFIPELAPITLDQGEHLHSILEDEGPDATKLAKTERLRPVFKPDGTITAANASSIADGAASLILMTLESAKKHGIRPLARLVAHANHAEEPPWFTRAPIGAIQKVLEKANWHVSDVDLFEINEAFAVVVMATLQEMALDIEKINVHGGACALGHPIGASGARIIVTLIHALRQNKKHRGIAALCIGGGEATAIALDSYEDDLY